MLEGINNIIFDLGGVILDIDFTKTIKAFQDLGVSNAHSFFTKDQPQLLTDLEIGKITPQQFRDQIKKISALDLTDSEINNAWNALLLKTPPERIDILGFLKQVKRTFLLSNTNQIHQDAFDKYYKQHHRLKNGLSDLFEQDHYSHIIKKRKPEASSFQYVLELHGLYPDETLFIDDSESNIVGAQKLGIKTWHLKQGESITQLLKTL